MTASTGDVNDPTAEAKELASVGKTEEQIERDNGETPGDRVGDEKVDGVEQTRTGTGEPLTDAKTPLPPEPPQFVAFHNETDATHVAVTVEQADWLHRELAMVEGLPVHIWHAIEHLFGKGA